MADLEGTPLKICMLPYAIITSGQVGDSLLLADPEMVVQSVVKR